MEIYGIPPSNNRIGSIDSRQKSTPPASENPSESVAAPLAVPKDRLENTGLAPEPEFEPRIDLITSVVERISGRDSYAPETNPGASPEAANGKSSETAVKTGSRSESEEIDRNYSAVYYSSGEITRQIAEKIAPVINISGLFQG
jgi:hypothetical protein